MISILSHDISMKIRVTYCVNISIYRWFCPIWGFPYMGVPLNHPFYVEYSLINHPAIGVSLSPFNFRIFRYESSIFIECSLISHPNFGPLGVIPTDVNHHMEVSWNRGTPSSHPLFVGFSIVKHHLGLPPWRAGSTHIPIEIPIFPIDIPYGVYIYSI